MIYNSNKCCIRQVLSTSLITNLEDSIFIKTNRIETILEYKSKHSTFLFPTSYEY